MMIFRIKRIVFLLVFFRHFEPWSFFCSVFPARATRKNPLKRSLIRVCITIRRPGCNQASEAMRFKTWRPRTLQCTLFDAQRVQDLLHICFLWSKRSLFCIQCVKEHMSNAADVFHFADMTNRLFITRSLPAEYTSRSWAVSANLLPLPAQQAHFPKDSSQLTYFAFLIVQFSSSDASMLATTLRPHLHLDDEVFPSHAPRSEVVQLSN